MGEMADWHLETMNTPCENCGRIHMTDQDDDDCEMLDEEE